MSDRPDPDAELIHQRLDEIRAAISSPLIPPTRARRVRDACRHIEAELDPTLPDDYEVCDDCGRVGLPEDLDNHVCRTQRC